MINLEHLTEEERKIIMDVLQRDEQLRQAEQERVKKLKTELHELRKKSAVKVDDDSSGDSGKKVCARCREPLGTIFNSGEVCPRCQHKVCSNCKVVLPNSKKWLCTICNKQLQIRLESGDAFGPQIEGQTSTHGTELVKMSLAQSTKGLDSSIHANRRPQSPADSGFHGRGPNAPSPGETNMGAFEEDYPSDASYEQSIGPSVSQRGSVQGSRINHTHEDSALASNGSAEIMVERVNSRTGTPSSTRRGANAARSEKSLSRQHHSPGRDRGNYQGHVEVGLEVSEDDRGMSGPPAIPTIAIHDAADSSFSEGEYYGSDRLHKQTLEGNYRGSTSSLTSLYSTGEEFYGKYPITGDVSFGLGYNFKTNVFEVKIGGCRDLVPIEAKKNKSDPYIKTYLLPDKTKNSKRKTRIKKGTINPNYSENLKYPIAQTELETRTLSVAVWHYDRFGHNMFLGEVLLPLDGVDLTAYPTKWHQLKTRVPPTETKPISYKGDVILALMFETTKRDENKNDTGTGSLKGRKKKKGLPEKQVGGCLKVHIKEAKNLSPPRLGAVINPYIKLYLEPDRSKSGKRKTAIMRNTLHPSYEQSLEFPNVTEEILKERALEVGVWDSDIGTPSFLGGVRLGLGTGSSYGRTVEWQDSRGIEIQLWEEMLRNHNQWVEASLSLRASFD